MSPEIPQWITPIIVIVVLVSLRRAMRQGMAQLREDMKELRGEVAALRDRMGRIEGTLDVLREFLVHKGRGTSA